MSNNVGGVMSSAFTMCLVRKKKVEGDISYMQCRKKC